MRAITSSMRVARLHNWGDVRVETMAVPRPGPGEALVRVEACGLCGSDALVWYVSRKAPVVLGHEPAGVIAAVGAGVTRFREGDRVFVHHHAPCGQCRECRRGLWSNCATWRSTQLNPGGFAEFALAPAPNVALDTLLLPDSMDFDTATFIEPVGCCIRAVHRQAGVGPGDVLCVIGLGAMGLVMVQLGRIHGARLVIGSDFIESRRSLARSLGADVVIDAGSGDVVADVRAATDGRGADAVIVCPGDPRAVQAGLAVAAPGGKVVCFTPQAPDLLLEIDQSALYFREITLVQSYSCGPDETRAALELLRTGSIDVRPLITHTDGLDGVGAALDRVAGKAGIKTVIHPWR